MAPCSGPLEALGSGQRVTLPGVELEPTHDGPGDAVHQHACQVEAVQGNDQEHVPECSPASPERMRRSCM